MSEEIKHSPTPWVLDGIDIWHKGTGYEGPDQHSYTGLSISKPLIASRLAQVNAAHIVKCVNLHEELVSALKSAIALSNVPEHVQDDEWYSDLAICEATLIKATK